MMTTPSPQWTAVDHHGVRHERSSYAGVWLLLYFYPKDDTPGCTIQACGLRDAWGEIQPLMHVLGVSKDSASSHTAFIEKFSLPFPLLVDTDGALARAFGIGKGGYPPRTSFLIDPQGDIRAVYQGFDCNDHAAMVCADVQRMRREEENL